MPISLKMANEAQFVRNLSAELSLQVVLHGATQHHILSSHTWIEFILVDENDTVLDARNILANFHSTHNIIVVSLTWVKPLLDIIRPIEYTSYKDTNPSELAEFLVGWYGGEKLYFTCTTLCGSPCLVNRLSKISTSFPAWVFLWKFIPLDI